MAKRIVGVFKYRPTGLTRETFSLRANLDKIKAERARLGIERPLRVGQGAVHNKPNFSYDHRNAADLGVHPNSENGMAMRDFLEANRIPYNAFTGPIPGVSTGPHIHIGFGSLKTTKRFPVGTLL